MEASMLAHYFSIEKLMDILLFLSPFYDLVVTPSPRHLDVVATSSRQSYACVKQLLTSGRPRP